MKGCETDEKEDRMSCDRGAVFERTETGVLNACEGRRECDGEYDTVEIEGDLKQSSLKSDLTALVGVIGAIDNASEFALLCSVWAPMAFGELQGTEEGNESQLNETEPI